MNEPSGGPADGLGAPGQVIAVEGSITLNEGAERTTVRVVNTGDRPVQVGSHYHFAVRFEPGVDREVTLVPLRGARIVPGLTRPAPNALDEQES